MTLPEEECAFFWAAMAQLEPPVRPIFAERVSAILAAHPAPDCGDVDRAVRAALIGLWTPPATEEVLRPSRWDRGAPRFERVSKGAEVTTRSQQGLRAGD
jgi:hypothetical protein